MDSLVDYVGKLVRLTIGHRENPTVVSHARVVEATPRVLVVEERGRRVSYPLLTIRAIETEA